MQRSKCKNANPKKVETRGFSRCPNPGFRVWQNVRVIWVPGFFKTRVSIPNSDSRKNIKFISLSPFQLRLTTCPATTKYECRIQ